MNPAFESPRQADVIALIQDLDAYQRPLYPSESHHGIDVEALAAPQVLFAVTRDDAGRAVACGAIVVGPAFGEVKRMYVQPAFRGRGLARDLLVALEERAIAGGCTTFALETGFRQPEAIGLYRRLGYVECGPFGDYAEDPNSVFMRKTVR